ncbi:MAG: alpha-(1-_3)-arabinofuranosyltransferase family protein [Lawsonella clevelandensis]
MSTAAANRRHPAACGAATPLLHATAPSPASPPAAPPQLPYLLSYLGFLCLTLLQDPGRTAADTKHDLTANPLGFLARSTSLWDSTAPMGQLQNQAYGYLFPQGPFFAFGHLLHLPGWLTQRLWWALLLWVGFWGIMWLARTLRIGGPRSRVAGALVYVLSPASSPRWGR